MTHQKLDEREEKKQLDTTPIALHRRLMALNKREWIIEGDSVYTKITNVIAYFDKEDLPILKQYLLQVEYKSYIFASVVVNGKKSKVGISRILMGMPPGHVDHIDRNPLNNRKSNLRVVTIADNLVNRAGDVDKKFKGVSWIKRNKYKAYLFHEGKRTELGYFDNAKDAAMAHDKALFEASGGVGYFNFPEEFQKKFGVGNG